VAPLLDAINDGCYKEMSKFMKKREEFFNKEIAALKKKEGSYLKKLEKLEPAVGPPKEEIKVQIKEKKVKEPRTAEKSQSPGKKTKKQI
jgi:hypothetical protein